jgi:hypothetical protein
MRAYTEVDDDQWALTETILDNPRAPQTSAHAD